MPVLKASKEETQGIWILIAKANKRVMVISYWLKANKGTMIMSSWQKLTIGPHLVKPAKKSRS